MGPSSTRAETFLFLAAVFLVLIGGTVIAGWFLKNQVLVTLYLSVTPMKFNAALCFLVSGGGYVSLLYRRTALARLSGFFVFVLGTLTFSEFLFGRPFGIDQLFSPQDWTGEVLPGRMAPNTAVALALCGIGLVLASTRRTCARTNLALAAMILAISLVAMAANITGLRSAFSWGRFNGMSARTAIGFVAIALAQMVWSIEQAQKQGRRLAWSLAFFSTGVASLLVLAAAIFVATHVQKSASTWLEHSERVLKSSLQIERDIARAESAVRGFLLSHDTSLLGEVSTLETTLRNHAEEIAGLTSDDPSQQERVITLRRALEARLASLRESATLRDQTADELIRRTAAGHALTQALGKTVENIVASEELLRTERLNQNDVSTNQLRGTSLFGCGLIVVLFLVAIILTLRAEKKQTLAEENLLQSNRSLEDKVHTRTVELQGAVDGAHKIEERLKAVLAHTPIVLWAIDQKGIFTMVEGRGLDSIQLDSAKLLGTSHLELVKTISPQTYASTLRALSGESFTTEHQHQSGTWYQTTYTSLKDEQGAVVEVVGISLEVTDTKKAEQLTIDERSARESSRLKSEFLANMSHEIRTPMNGVIGMITLLMDTGLSIDQREMARVVQNSAESLLSIINDILDFSKIEAGKMRIEESEFDLRQLIDESLALLAPRAHEKGLELICDFDLRLPTGMRGDGGRIRQVITNLVGNAIKFTANGEVVVLIQQDHLTADRVGFRLEVSDTGIGIPEGVQKGLFQPFEQGESGTTRRFGGTGLGLAICRQLIELMVGTIGFKSTPDHGSTFWFALELPRATIALADTIAPFDVEGHVLVVDDNVTIRRILTAQLAKFGFTSEATDSATSALSLLSQNRAGLAFNLAILDWRMPGIDALQLTRQIRQDSRYVALPIIVLSSSVADTFAAKALGILVLAKPAREAQLRRIISQALSGAPTTQAESNFIPRSTQSRRILLADDNETNQLVGRMLLEKMGHVVVVVENGVKAIEALKENSFDLVFMDCQMPELDGYEATHKIRQGAAGEAAAKLPVIALTAYAMASDRIKCLEAGMNDYLSKPLRVEDVSNIILRTFLERADAALSVPWDGTGAPFDLHPLSQFEGMVSDGQPVAKKFLELFEREEPKRLALMKTALETRSAKQLAVEAHSMAGTCGSLGGREVRARAHGVEQAALQGDWERLPSKISGLEKSLTRLHEELRRFVS